MGIFDDKKQNVKEAEQKANETKVLADETKLRDHGLLVSELDDDQIRQQNVKSMRRIVGESGWAKYWSVATYFSNAAEKVEINLLKVLTEQQSIVIRQNEQIIRLLQNQQGNTRTE